MAQHLLLTVRFPGDAVGTARFHGMTQGSPEWPPAPARVFQALVAGGARGNGLPEVLAAALAWLETLPAPTITAPERHLGQQLTLFVPNNDADALEDPRDVGDIRTKKLVQPSLFAADTPLHYVWSFEGSQEHAGVLVRAAADVHRLGRGVDIAWADGEIVGDDALAARLDAYPGRVHRATAGGSGDRALACPTTGSLASLEERHRTVRLRSEGTGRSARVLFTNAPKPRFAQVGYAREHRWTVYELRDRESGKAFPWSLARSVALVERLRDTAAGRLRDGLPGQKAAIEAALVGRKADGRDAAPSGDRVRIVPLPSIGSEHVDRAIRRVAIDVPSGAALRSNDVEWAFSGLALADAETGEVGPVLLTPTEDRKMFGHYQRASRRWRTVTPAALPTSAARGRHAPTRRSDEATPAAERAAEEARAVGAVRTALRHADVPARALSIRVQREPFERRGTRAEPFAEGSRFAKERLWHVELELDRPVEGPLLLGDGRFLGLGLLAPALDEATGVWAFEIANGLESSSATEIARALRRAVMARVQQRLGARTELPTFFSGHDEEGRPARQDTDPHLAFSFDHASRRLFVIAPHLLDRREPTGAERAHLAELDAALAGFTMLLAGRAGRLELRPAAVDHDHDALLGASRVWKSASTYVATRHAKAGSAREALVADVASECRRLGLPTPEVSVQGLRGVSGVGLVGHVTLAFDTSVAGPLLLGKSRYLGGGLFVRGPRAG